MNETSIVEEYECPRCKKDYLYEDIYFNWVCPECNSSIVIHADFNGHNHSILRIRAGALKPGDQVILRTDSYSALNISHENGQVRIALKDFGVIYKNPDEFVACIIGAGRRWNNSIISEKRS
jgi:DNA-directed RNA polymerase subunit RPC12/RpoP